MIRQAVTRPRMTRQRIKKQHFSADRGSIMPLVSLFITLGLLVVLVTTAAVSLYLERKQLFSLADGAALFAAEAFDVVEVEILAGRPQLVLDNAKVERAAVDYLSGLELAHEDLQIISAYSPDQRSARVGLQSYWRPPLLTLFVPEGLEIQVEATARVVFSQR